MHPVRAVPEPRRPHGRIHLAGGDSAPMGIGGAEGAVETGANAARNVAAASAAGRH
ncbi:hypothetical protein GCM10010377_23630 [Streptomyces viridiviolaceus]|uniref:FAD-dependent oxidoreductase n=1 Tax=Streptomyces viridiviolaceus TaxID=68282 RepID=A0ABW2DV52_9ACTN|nr:FAD-dependent oxidoreductase [Streptomyces viridiviolaceus]GHB32513.1 hypothetical protein GCM10010377_23630 [Streptomyces viridiviolaceus]